MKARELMTPMPALVTPSDKIFRAAEIMKYEDIGCVPVIGDTLNRRLVGLLTDRDISVRCTARRHGTECLVRDHMTPLPLNTVGPDATTAEIISKMENAHVRRLPVVDSDGSLIGIISEADLITKLPEPESLFLHRAKRKAFRPPVSRIRFQFTETATSNC